MDSNASPSLAQPGMFLLDMRPKRRIANAKELFDMHKSGDGFGGVAHSGREDGFFYGGLREDSDGRGGRGRAVDDGFQGLAVAGAAGDELAFEFDEGHARRGDADVELCF